MLHLVIGRNHSGKSKLLYETAIRRAKTGERQIFLVPEQFSHDAERRLCEMGGDAITRHCEVLTFHRLANRIFSECGGLSEQVMDAGARILVMHQAFSAVEDKLSFYGNSRRKQELLQELLHVVDEFKSCNISVKTFDEIYENCDPILENKLRDILLIYNAYCALCQKDVHDPRDLLTKATDLIANRNFLSDAVLYVDEFFTFSNQELLLLDALGCKERYAAFSCTDLYRSQLEPYEIGAQTALQFAQSAERHHMEYEIIRCSDISVPDDLDHLNQLLFDYSCSELEDNPEHISLWCAPQPYVEYAHTAHQIRKLLREQHVRCRDIAVVTNNLDECRDVLSDVFSRYEIPFYITQVNDLQTKSVTALILSALDIIAGNYRLSDIFAYLRTNLTNISMEDCDLLQNYCELWNIHAGQWKRSWDMHPGGFGKAFTQEDCALLEMLNRTREAVVQPLLRLEQAFRDSKTGIEQASALYQFMIDIGLYEKIEQKQIFFHNNGDYAKVDEYRQLWDVLCDCLDSFVSILGSAAINTQEFIRLFSLALRQYDIGAIPSSIDRVCVGAPERMNSHSWDYVFFLDVNDGVVPRNMNQSGLLNERDRKQLESQGIVLYRNAQRQCLEELSNIHRVICKAHNRVGIYFVQTGLSGTAVRPSFLVHRIKKLFPKINISDCLNAADPYQMSAQTPCTEFALSEHSLAPAVRQALEQNPHWKERLSGIDVRAQKTRAAISPQMVQALYGKNIRLTPSRLDSFNACHFKYFAQYGLRLNPRLPAGFHAPEIGDFLHYVLENTVREVSQDHQGFSNCDLEIVRQITKKHTQQYADRFFSEQQKQNPRFQFQYRRTLRTLELLLSNIYREFSVSLFTPLDFELSFSKDGDLPPIEITLEKGVTAVLAGKVDRIDGWVSDGTLYLRVIDYKSGTKTFSYTDIANGLSLQLPVYLFAIRENSETYFKLHPELNAAQILPAGILYTPVRTEILTADHDVSDQTLNEKLDDKLKRSGVVLDDIEIVNAMEPGTDSAKHFIPVSFKNDGTIMQSRSSVLSMSEFQNLEKHLKRALKACAELIASGTVDTDPIRDSSAACMYCDYRKVCQFDPANGVDTDRYCPTIQKQDFFAAVQEAENGNSMDTTAENSN